MLGTPEEETQAGGLVWGARCGEEIGSWGVFLPQLYNLYKVVTNTDYNPYADLSVEGKGKDLKYKYIK